MHFIKLSHPKFKLGQWKFKEDYGIESYTHMKDFNEILLNASNWVMCSFLLEFHELLG